MTDQTQPETRLVENIEKRVFVGFAGIVTMGLFLGGWYVSSRILLAGKPQSMPQVESPVLSSPPILAKAVEAPKIVAQAVQPPPPPVRVAVKREHISPQPGETYLQLAAMGPHATEEYLQELAAKGIHPLIAPGPSENIARFLVGPFAKNTDMQKAQSALAGQGIQAMVRDY
jgi:cell division septation protein DedD